MHIFAWGIGFELARSVDRLAEQIQFAVAAKTPVVAIADILSDIITLLRSMSGQAQGRLSDGVVRASLWEKCRRVCLRLLAVQHSFLDVMYHRAVHAGRSPED